MVGLTSGAALHRAGGPSALVLLSIAALVFAGACGGLALSDLIGRVSAIWVANAILVYFLLNHPRRHWLSILGVGLGANFAADLFMGDAWLTGAALTLCNAVGVLIIAAPLKFLKLDGDLSRPKPLCVFYALALGPAPAVSGLLSAAFFELMFHRAFLTQALDWYATDALGYSIVVPMLMTVRLDALKRMFARDQLIVTLALLAVVFGTLLLNFTERSYPLAFLFFPAVILITFQRGFAGGSIGLLAAAAYLMIPVLAGDSRGALAEHTLREQIILVQVFIAVIGFSELMNDELYGPLGDERYREYCGLIRGAGHHLLSLINDVLDMSKIEAGKLELHRQVFDIREIVNDCLGLMRERAAQGGVMLSCDIQQGPLRVDADRRAMKQILLNLLSNAVKFTPEGGKVAVRARAQDGLLALSVEDTGIGIPSDQVSRLGNPFVQIRNSAGASHEGTGLGLALVRALAEVHSGKFGIESVQGKGTTVSVTLPLARDEELALAG